MSAVANANSLCTGHNGFPPRHPTSWSDDVTAEGLGVVRESDSWATHCNGDSCHAGVGAIGFPAVTVNGIPVMTVGSKIDCGSYVASGAGTVGGG